jgi:hypothetical protein
MTRKQISTRVRQATRLWASDLVSREINKANRLAWLRAVEQLGDKWLLAKPQAKEQA